MTVVTRREWLLGSAGLGITAAARLAFPFQSVATSREDESSLESDLIPAPDDPNKWPAFRTSLERWRDEAGKRISYDDSRYRSPDFNWAARCYVCGFVMLCDETFRDRAAGNFRVEAFLDEARRDFGGFDAVVLWHAYPRIGLDDRNQFDFYRDFPGGLPGLRTLVGRFHARGVRVFIDYNPWDTGTRRETGSDVDALGQMVAAINVDGVFLDTLDKAVGGLRDRLDATGPGLVLESEIGLPLDRVCDHQMAWGQWLTDSAALGILRNRWLERRHMVHMVNRWDRDHSGELQTAWMNGAGMLVWENVFGSWSGWNSRDKSILRSMVAIQRRFHALFAGPRWTPLVPTEHSSLFASRWENDAGVRLWTLVNRSDRPIEGPLLKIPAGESRVFDLIRGTSATVRSAGGERVIDGAVPPRGIAGFLVGPDRGMGVDFDDFLRGQAAMLARSEWSARFEPRTARLVVPAPTRRYERRDVPEGMIPLPAANLKIKTVFRVRECGFYDSQDDEFVASRYPRLHHERVVQREISFRPLAIDRTPVTNAQYSRFLAASAYRPREDQNFLRHWGNERTPRPGTENHPVVYVDLDDARAYARWAGKRLPTEEEWQYAAQGSDGRRYPWGDSFKADLCNGGASGGTTPVDAYPDGRSPCGCLDMCGNTWELTESERGDGRTRFAILKGGSFYRAAGSDWYVSGGPQSSDTATKMLLHWPALDRCATVGFRCAIDLAE